jgi:aspartate racemase
MKTIGLLGGVSWHSTLEYYRYINQFTNNKLGGYHSAKLLIYSFNFAEIRELHATSEALLCKRLVIEARNIENGGADCILIGANTLHMFYDDIQKELKIPIIHVADAIAESIKKRGIKKVGLLGTLATMEKAFYFERLKRKDIQVVVPEKHERKIINDIIYNELVYGKISGESKTSYLNIIFSLIAKENIRGIILGCTEIPLLISTDDVSIPLFNSTEIHAEKVVEYALNG